MVYSSKLLPTNKSNVDHAPELSSLPKKDYRGAISPISRTFRSSLIFPSRSGSLQGVCTGSFPRFRSSVIAHSTRFVKLPNMLHTRSKYFYMALLGIGLDEDLVSMPNLCFQHVIPFYCRLSAFFQHFG